MANDAQSATPYADAVRAYALRPFVLRQRLRSGWALKRLEDEADHERYMLRDLEGTLMRMSEPDAQLVELLDGKRTVAELLAEGSGRLGPSGAKRVVVGGLLLFFMVLLLPIPIALGAPLLQRARFGTREVNRVVK